MDEGDAVYLKNEQKKMKHQEKALDAEQKKEC